MDVKDLMRELAEHMEKAANVKAVFGEPTGEGDIKVIPVARVSLRGGGGGGAEGPTDSGLRGRGRGMGLGLNLVTSPVGYIEVRPTGAMFVPVTDRNRVIVAGVVAMVLGFLMLGRLRK